MAKSHQHHYFITGVSSGIGLALAKQLLAAGHRVTGIARRQQPLTRLAKQHPYFLPITADVSDAIGMAKAVAKAEAKHGAIDTAILNAGVYRPLFQPNKSAELPLTASTEDFARHMQINYMGQIHGLVPLLPRMSKRKRGHIVLMASVAAWGGLPLAAAYAPSKAASLVLAECLVFACRPYGIKIQVVCPGFVATEATANNEFTMPMLMPSEAAAQAIIKGMARGRFMIGFPFGFILVFKILRVLPYAWYFWLVRRITQSP